MRAVPGRGDLPGPRLGLGPKLDRVCLRCMAVAMRHGAIAYGRPARRSAAIVTHGVDVTPVVVPVGTAAWRAGRGERAVARRADRQGLRRRDALAESGTGGLKI